MNITSAGLYWITRADTITTFSEVVIWLWVLVLSISTFMTYVVNEDKDDSGFEKVVELYKTLKWFLIFTVVPAISITLFVPTAKELAIIFVAPVVMNNEDVQKIPIDILKLARQELDKLLEIKEGKTK